MKFITIRSVSGRMMQLSYEQVAALARTIRWALQENGPDELDGDDRELLQFVEQLEALTKRPS